MAELIDNDNRITDEEILALITEEEITAERFKSAFTPTKIINEEDPMKLMSAIALELFSTDPITTLFVSATGGVVVNIATRLIKRRYTGKN